MNGFICSILILTVFIIKMPGECARSTCSNNSLKRDTFADYHTFSGKKAGIRKHWILLSSEEILVLI